MFAGECTGEASISKGGLEVLAAETRTSSVEGFAEKKILTLGGRQKNYLRVTYNRGDLPILPAHYPLSRLYLEEAHKVDHAGVEEPISGVDYASTHEGGHCKEGVLHVQEYDQEVGGAEDGAPAGAQDGANATILFHASGSVRPPAHQRIRE